MTTAVQEPIAREVMERFAVLASGLSIAEAIRAAYSNESLRAESTFMEWLVKPGSRAVSQMAALGVLTYDRDADRIGG
jgi:hypothetical protein